MTANDAKGEGEICHKIGNLYLERGDYERALKYQLRDLELAKKADEVSDFFISTYQHINSLFPHSEKQD